MPFSFSSDTIFWGVLIAGVLFFFHAEIRALLDSLLARGSTPAAPLASPPPPPVASPQEAKTAAEAFAAIRVADQRLAAMGADLQTRRKLAEPYLPYLLPCGNVPPPTPPPGPAA